MQKFESGKTYSCRSICDHNCIFTVTILSRTEKTVTTTDGKKFRVNQWHDGSAEYIKPMGSYSMAPMIRADKGKLHFGNLLKRQQSRQLINLL